MSAESYILGINPGRHDSSAALLCGGELVVVAEQERLSRTKHAIGEAPVEAIRYCLDCAGIELSDVHCAALGTNLPYLADSQGLNSKEASELLALIDPDSLFPREVFGMGARPPLRSVSHHLAHAASAFDPSGYEEAAILVVDNRGEDSSTSIAHGTAQGIDVLESHGIDVSLGLFYRAAAQYTGTYRRYGEVGKMMGLAAYGQAVEPMPLTFLDGAPALPSLPTVSGLRGFDVPKARTEQLLSYFEQNCYPYARGDGREVFAYANFAASAQAALEDVLLALARRARTLTDSTRLVMAGGVALNCTANGRLANEAPFERVFVQPQSHDSGVALGAALVAHREDHGAPARPVMEHALWGPGYDQDEIDGALRAADVPHKHFAPQQLADKAASLIADGAIVVWHQGRAEIGPRALGARSLLGDPRSRLSLVRMNELKQREMWRPFAPSVKAECFDDFFDGVHASPFMLAAARVREEMRSRVPAVVHADGSARPQAVSRDFQPAYWNLLNSMEECTGIPMVLNTSLNRRGEPIANTPAESIDVFTSTDADAIVIGSALATKA